MIQPVNCRLSPNKNTKVNTMSTKNNAASKSTIIKPTEQQHEAATSMLQKIVLSGIIWRSNERMALWAIADNNFMFVFKTELEKGQAYAMADMLKTKKAITACNWNKVGFATRDTAVQTTDAKQEMLAI